MSEYDDGRKEVFFCLAANLMDVGDLKTVLDKAEAVDVTLSQTENAASVKIC